MEKPDLVTKVSTLYEIVLEAAQKGAAPLGPKDWAAAVMDRVYDEFCRSTGQAMKESWRDDRDFCSASAWIYEEADHFKDDLYPHIGFHGFVFVERNAAIVSATHFMGWRRVGRSSNRALGEN